MFQNSRNAPVLSVGMRLASFPLGVWETNINEFEVRVDGSFATHVLSQWSSVQHRQPPG